VRDTDQVGCQLKIIAAILGQSVIEKIFTHLRLQASAQPRSTALGPQFRAA